MTTIQKICLITLFLAGSVAQGADSVAASGQQERAVSALEEDLKTDPTNPELWLHMGFAYRKAGQINDAQKAFEKAVSLNPKEDSAYYMLGLIYESKQMKPEAIKAWQAYLAAEKDPEKQSVAQKHIHHLSQ